MPTPRILTLISLIWLGTSCPAQTMIADKFLGYHPSGTGPMQEPYGGDKPNVGRPIFQLRDHAFALDGNPNTWVALPKGASLIVGFTKGVVFDGPGDDLFICEVGKASERANVFISSDFGKTFTLFGSADGGTVTRLDLKKINFSGKVNAVKITGLDTLGSSPGFDVCYVEGLEGSVQSPGAVSANGKGGSIADVFNGTAKANDSTPDIPAVGKKKGGSLSDLFGKDD